MSKLTTTPPHSPFRFAKGLSWWVKFYETNSISMQGLEHIKTLNAMTKGRVIIVTPHERDSDVTIPATTLLNDKQIQNIYPFAIKIANSSTHHHLFQDTLVHVGITLLGKDNFYSIDYKKENGQWKAKKFNEANFQPIIQDILSEKNDVLIAMYGPPPKDQPKNERKPGIGAVYLAQMAHAPILPVKVTYSGNTKKPNAIVIFGKPFFETGTDAKEMHNIYKKIKIGQQTEKDMKRREELKQLLRKKAKRIMLKIL